MSVERKSGVNVKRFGWLPRVFAIAVLGAVLIGPLAARPALAGDDVRVFGQLFFGFPPPVYHGHTHHYGPGYGPGYHPGYHGPAYYGPRYSGYIGYGSYGHRGHHRDYDHDSDSDRGHKYKSHGNGHRHGHGCRH